MLLSENIKTMIRSQYDESAHAKTEIERGELFQSICRELKAANGEGTIDLGKAVSIYFHLDQEFAEELAFIRKLQGDDYFQNEYNRMISDKVEGKNTFQRAALPTDSSSYNGDNDISETIVEKSIITRLEAESAIMSFVKRKSTTGFKVAQFPIYGSTTVAATYKAKGATFDDFSDDTTGGVNALDNVKVEPQKIGFTQDFEAEAFVKLNAVFVSELIDIMYKLYYRGVMNGLYLGNGTSPNPLGMFTNATSVTYATSAANTIQKMLASVGDAARSQEGYFLVTNTAGASVLAFEKLNNQAFDVNINLSKPGLAGTVMGLPIVIDNSFQASGTSPSKGTPLYLGTKGHYLFAEGLAPKIETNEISNFKSGLQTVRVMAINGGRPAFADSFAKTTLPNVY